MVQKKISEQVFNDAIISLHSPNALQTIGDAERELLARIARSLPKTPTSFEDFVNAAVGEGHESFEYSDMDCATVFVALNNPNAAMFFAPLMGGRSFLEHIPLCEFCLLSVMELDFVDIETIAVLNEVFYIAERAGIEINPKAKIIQEMLILPKKN